MLKPALSKVWIPLVAFLSLAFSPSIALAQRGGGHGGGGFHGGGGGGFHGGGGGGFHGGSAFQGGGGFRGSGSFGGGFRGGSAPRAGGFGGNRNFGGSFRGGAFASRGPAGVSRGFGSRGATADGRWHSFGTGRAFSSPRVSPGFHGPAIADGRWHSFGPGTSSTFARGFSGPGLRVFGPRGGRGFGGWGFRGSGFGCWGCGFGWGFSWGWGWPWTFGWGPAWGWPGPYYDPWWWNPYSYAYPAYPYDDYGPPYAPPASDDSDYGDYYSYGPPYAPPPDADDSYGDSTAQSQSAPATNYSSDPGPTTGNVAESMPTILLYLTDGTVYPATQYWVSGSTLHYVVAYGGESTVPIDQVDMRRTIDENAKRGVRFNLRPRSYRNPTTSVPAPPSVAPAPYAQPIARSNSQPPA